MSSNKYSAFLTPEPPLRRIVLASGCLLSVLGTLVIAALPLHGAIRTVIFLAWSGWSWFELRPYQQAYESFTAIRLFAGGSAMLLNVHQEWVPVSLQAGSVLLWRIGWLRFETPDGRQFAELLRKSAQHHREWRRLQVIWRHIGATD